MSALDNNVETTNMLSPFGFKLEIKRLPNVQWFVQAINIPGITTQPINLGTPFTNIRKAGDHIEYEDLNITFKIDEMLNGYFEIHNWIRGLGFPEDFKEYANLKDKPDWTNSGLFSEIDLFVLDSAKKPIYIVKFEDAFPYGISSLNFNTTDTNVNHITVNTLFKYTKFEFEKVI